MKRDILHYFSPFEILLWTGSVLAVVLSFVLCKNTDWLNLAGSILGATALIFVSKGNVIGQMLCVVFAAYYGFVSYGPHYYGEMITYLGMSAPMALAAVISWLRHPFREDHAEVEIRSLKAGHYAAVFLLGAAVTTGFWFLLGALGTENLIWSTVSVATSFVAVSFTFLRSPLYALAYACNDVVLIVLWSLASAKSTEYIALVVCFAVFLALDLYGLCNWLRMKRRQRGDEAPKRSS